MSAHPYAIALIDEHYRIQRLPSEMAIAEAMAEARRRANRCKTSLPVKPVIRVFKTNGNPVLVLRVGRYFVSSYTWTTLIRKAANPYKWSLIADTTMQFRWKE